MTTNDRGYSSGGSGYHLVLGLSAFLLLTGCELNKDGSLVGTGPLQPHAEVFKNLPDMTDAELIDYRHRLRARLNELDSADDPDPDPFRQEQLSRAPPSRDENPELRSISDKLAEVQAEMDSRKLRVR